MFLFCDEHKYEIFQSEEKGSVHICINQITFGLGSIVAGNNISHGKDLFYFLQTELSLLKSFSLITVF